MTAPIRFLTIRQPWASLIAVGAKTIETRPFSTTYRGPLAIHAGKAWPVPVAEWQVPADRSSTVGAPCVERLVNPADPVTRRWEMLHTPLGAVVAVCDLIDVVPTSEIVWYGNTESLTGRAWQPPPSDLLPEDKSFWEVDANQKPLGDFTTGRFAWLLDNVRAINPVPMKGAQGLRDLPTGVVIP